MTLEKSQLMNEFPPAIFGQLKAAANKRLALGKEVIDLSLGSPDIPPAKIIREKLAEESIKASSYGYTLGGLPHFNEAVANYYERRSHVKLNPATQVLQTMGSQEGLIHLPLAFCNEGDIVLTTNPAYVAYDTGIKLAKATPYYLPLKPENNFLPDLTGIPDRVLEKAKLLILNLPGNPVPAMPTIEFFNEVVQLAKKHRILVLHDAAYSEFYFTGAGPLSFLQAEGAIDVGLEINSLSKSFSLAGARIAYIVGNENALEVLQQFKTNLDYGTFSPIQEAAIVALNHAEEITENVRKTFKKRHEIVMEGLRLANWTAAPSNGGMFVWAKYPYALEDTDFALKVIEQTGVVMVPGSAFGTEGVGYVRIALVKNDETLLKAMDNLHNLVL